jgi:membrane-associated phospholipid phosphatase
MALVDILLQVGLVVGAGHLLGYWLLLGGSGGHSSEPTRGLRRRVAGDVRWICRNLRSAAPTLAVLGGVLAVNSVVRDIGVELSWLIGVNITGYIFLVESELVATIQSIATPALTAYFGFVYVFGYTFLLTFPVLAYLLADGPRPVRVLFTAYILNYGFGLVCYVLFVAYGPRNFMPELVDPLLYTAWPQSQLLVQQVNTNTNVFPSLHTSLSVTVALVAVRFRDIYPRWTPVAGLLAASIVFSTMYLGIHWATDVVAGAAVGWASVALAARIDDDPIAGAVRRWRKRRGDTVSK